MKPAMARQIVRIHRAGVALLVQGVGEGLLSGAALVLLFVASPGINTDGCA